MRLMILVAISGLLSGAALAQNITGEMTNDPVRQTEAPSDAPPSVSPPAPAPLTPPRNRGAMMQACQADFVALCPGMTPGDGKLGPCIRANRANLSPTCQSALRADLGARGARRGSPAPAPVPSP